MRLLENRLHKVESQLVKQSGPGNLSSHAVDNENIHKTSPGDTVTESGQTPLYEGESSFASQSAQAKEIVERFAHPNTGPDASNLSATLDSINSLLGSNFQNKPVANEANIQSNPTNLPLPAELIVAMLRRFQGKQSTNIDFPRSSKKGPLRLT